ncbi:MAG: primosomal protein N' [Alphaproteobacteria bacterium]|nr:primosomal protein N' [Alphaproteobacteria bacterium]
MSASSRLTPRAAPRAAARTGRAAPQDAAQPLPGFEESGEPFELDAVEVGPLVKVSVLFPLPLPEPFDYQAPAAWGLEPGMHVVAPLGPRLLRGVVWAVTESPAAGNLKPIDSVEPAQPLPEISRRFVDWIARYVVSPPGLILRMVARSPDALRPSPTYAVYASTGALTAGVTPARAKVLAAAAQAPGTPADLARRAGVSSGVVKALIDTGALAREERLEDPPYPEPNLDGPAPDGRRLSDDQARAAAELIAPLREGGFQVTLLDGVTGSGKTEVYLEAVAEALRADPTAQVLVLLPEIALTQAILARFEHRFDVRPVEWHSAITQKDRRRAWREINEGRARLVAGARSALFLPFRNLKLIVIDEEHDPSYKQDDGVAYQARDLAVARAKLGGCAVVLASATPSLETLTNARAGRYRHVKLTARHGVAVLPDIHLIDMKTESPERGRWLSPTLVRATAEALAAGEQALFYLNRRGYAPLTLCRSCGHRMQAPDTQSWLVEHRYSGRLVCHLTGYSIPKPKECPECLAPDSFAAIGPGVERVEEEARELFPGARVAIFSSDTAPTGADVRSIVDAMAAGEIDILVGTQIVAKGHNFPRLTVVGVVDADLGLKGGDLRAGERAFQLLSQVAGRAGRADRPGRAYIQTYCPEHDAMQALARQDRDGFLEIEASQREALGMPPFGRLAAVIVSGGDEAQVNAAAQAMGAAHPDADKVDVWGPAPAPLAVIRGQHRRRFLIRADRGVDLSAFLGAWAERVKLPASVRVQIDVDPYSFL